MVRLHVVANVSFGSDLHGASLPAKSNPFFYNMLDHCSNVPFCSSGQIARSELDYALIALVARVAAELEVSIAQSGCLSVYGIRIAGQSVCSPWLLSIRFIVSLSQWFRILGASPHPGSAGQL